MVPQITAFLLAILCSLGFSSDPAGFDFSCASEEFHCTWELATERQLALTVNISGAVVARNETFASLISKNANMKSTLTSVLRLFENVNRTFLHKDPRTGGPWSCSDEFSMNYWNRIYCDRGWGGFNSRCENLIDSRHHPREMRSAQETFSIIRRFSLTARSLAPFVVKSYGLSWDKTFSTAMLPHDPVDGYRTCTVAKIVGHFVKGEWAAAVDVTDIFPPSSVSSRSVLTEFVTSRGEGTASPVPMTLRLCQAMITGPPRYMNGTAVLSTSEGPILWTTHRPYYKEICPPVADALQLGEVGKEKLENADNTSGLLILVLPALLVLCPIGFFQDISFKTVLLYGAITDIGSVTPLAIRGIELIVYGSMKHYSLTTRTLGFEPKVNGRAIVETWAAECRMKPSVQQRGIGILSGALLAMLLGVVLEAATHRLFVHVSKKPMWEGVASIEDNDHSKSLYMFPKRA